MQLSQISTLEVPNGARSRSHLTCRSLVCCLHCQATKKEAAMDERFMNAQSWKSLTITAHKAWQERRAVKKTDVINIE